MNAEVELRDGRIALRPCRPSDADAIHAAVRESIAEREWGGTGTSSTAGHTTPLCTHWFLVI